MIRRCISFLLLLCLTLYSGESLVADVHDGDATAAELESERGLHGGGHLAASSDAGASAKHGPGDGDTSPGRSSGQPVHEQHACHCIHAHGFADPMLSPSGSLDHLHLTAPASHSVRMPPSLEREPQLRPPIAV